MAESKLPEIAIVASVGLGDGTIMLILADNIARHGFSVTMYSTPLSHLADWLPHIKVKPYPRLDDCEREFAPYDLVFADSISILGKPHWKAEDFPVLARKYVYLGVGRVEQELRFDHTERIRSYMEPEMFAKCAPLAASAGEVRFQGGDHNITQVKSAVKFCRDVWKIADATSDTGLTPPASLELKHRGNSRRVAIHAFSSNEAKNWPLKKFIRLAEKMQADGYEPVFVGSQPERERFLQAVGDRFKAPKFASISELAAFIYESGMLIGNDSGVIHLASCLGVPSVAISSKKNHRWRPDWCSCEVVLPYFKIKLGRRRIWKPFTTVNKVYLALKRQIAANC